MRHASPVGAGQQGTDAAPLHGRSRESADDEFLAGDALDLAPVAIAVRPVARVAAFRNDTLQRQTAGLLKKGAALALQMIAVEDIAAALAERGHESAQRVLARMTRRGRQVVPVEEQEVEDIIGQRRLEACAQG